MLGKAINAHLLLVEDDPINQVVIKGLLSLLHCQVTLAKNGKEALALLTAPHAAFDAVLMDVGLPDINGIEVTRQLRKSNSPMREVPVVALTGHVTQKDQQACIDCGMNRFISKPTTRDVLEKELGTLLLQPA